MKHANMPTQITKQTGLADLNTQAMRSAARELVLDISYVRIYIYIDIPGVHSEYIEQNST